MSEKFPNKQPQKIEGRENTERPPRYRTIKSEIIAERKDGAETVRVIECNGINHRCCVDTISYDDTDQITFVDQLSRDELGTCDCIN